MDPKTRDKILQHHAHVERLKSAPPLAFGPLAGASAASTVVVFAGRRRERVQTAALVVLLCVGAIGLLAAIGWLVG